MKPDWDKLMDAYTGSPTVVVADVDCTTEEGKPVCEDQEVKGFPTIKYFDEDTGASGAKYEGQRDLKTLKKFVKKTLKGVERKCDVVSKDGCLPEEVKVLEKWEKETSEKQASELKRLDHKLQGALKQEERKAVIFQAKIIKMLTKPAAAKQEL